MKRNVGYYDRGLRLVLSIGLIVIAAVHVVPGYWNLITWCVAGILLLTGVFGICPLYGACGIDTRKDKQAADAHK
ncbi:MAG TPA: DUF2892 domain-containing protein [Puia sp.]|nr:DUF2892 domain-containing protein [Puia sp.]